MSEGSKVTIRVVVADDHAIVREGIRQVLDGTEGITVVGEAANGPAAFASWRASRPPSRGKEGSDERGQQDADSGGGGG